MLKFIGQKDCSINITQAVRKLTTTLLVLLFTALNAPATASAQDYSGIYYIASNGYNANNTTTNFYLCPTENWNYYQSTSPYYTAADNGQPFMTTYQCRNGSYTASNAVWIVQKKAGEDFYYIIHAIDGYYLTRNVAMGNNSNVGRMRVHLEEFLADDDDALFEIVWVSDKNCYDIKTKKNDGTSGENFNRRFLNVTDGNKEYLQASGKNDGPKVDDKSIAVGGIIGLWTKGSGNNETNGMWYLESTLLSAPTITYNYSQENLNFTVTITNNSLPVDYDILYTTNGDIPTVNGATTSTYEDSFITTNDCTIKAVVARGGTILTEVASVFVGRPNAPTITPPSDCNNLIEMSADAGTIIYYTLDGTNPNSNSTLYTGPFTLNQEATIKAVAYNGNTPSYISTCNFTSPYTIKPTITQNGVTITITGAGSIYYTTDGSEPSTNSTSYTDPIILTGSNGDVITIKAVAKDGSKGLSCVAEKTVTVAHFINDLTSLQTVSSHPNDLCILTADIDASNLSASISGFTGVFDGDFHTIRGLTKPLFDNLNGATVKNVILDNVAINGNTDAGAICYEATGSTRIYNCGVLATTGSTVRGTGHVGGIVGTLSGNARVINCYSFANVSGGSYTAGIVGYNSVATTQNNVGTAGMVMNCMFYGDITGGSNISPVYGGELIDNAGATGVNNYNYYRRNRYDRETDTYVDDVTFDNSLALADYQRSWPADAKYLIRFEYYRSILNSNKKLCTWWVKGTNGTAPTDQDIEEVGIAKWVLDPCIAPYPILKKWGKYPSVINQDPDKRFNPSTNAWENRADASANWGKDMAPDTEGQKLGTVTVTIKGGDHHSGSTIRSINITAMDTLLNDYCYGKIQLPYYNEIFGNPDGGTWEAKYGGNYTEYVVTGWDISGGNVATGYNFADRNSYSGRVYAQGGYFYVPNGVTSITITAHWADAVYLCNKDYSIDRVNVAAGGKKNNNAAYVAEYGSSFAPAGTIPTEFQHQTVYTTIKEAIGALSTTSSGKDVYNQAIVLIGNVQLRNHSSVYGATEGATRPFTLMSADLDFDNEPDNCLELQFRNDIDRPGVQPIRFDFLPVPELGLAIRTNQKAYAIGIMIPLGHFEITETAFMHTTQFEYDANVTRSGKSPVIINGGEHEMFTVRKHASDRTSYFLLGGNAWIHRFAPGAHPNTGDKPNIYLCPINVIGGEIKELYLSGLYRPELSIPKNQGDPSCYIDGGKFSTVAGAGYDKVAGNVTFKIDHSLIGEFYGGGINGSNPIGGNIDVTINNSRVSKYCGGPKVGNMTGKTITTHATGTTFGVFYGGGNGGNSYYRQLQRDGDFDSNTMNSNWESTTIPKPYFNFNGFSPLEVFDSGTDNKGYHAEYEFEVFNQSNGLVDQITQRGFIQWIQFGVTITGNVVSMLTNCTVESNYYGGGNLATVNGTVSSTLTNTTVNGNVYGAGFSASIPTFQVHDKSSRTFPSIDDAGVITAGSISYDSKVYEWTNNPDAENHDDAYMKAHPTYQKDGKWYCYTWNSLENLGVVTGDVTLNIQGNTIVMGNVIENNRTTQSGGVYGGGDASGVHGSTHVEIDASGQKSGYAYNTYNVFGGGNKADVGGSVTVNMKRGVVDNDIYGGGALAHTNINNSGNTTDNVTSVNLTGGTVKGDVYGGGLGDANHAALVNGNVQVTVDGGTISGDVYGCNNVNGAPQGTVTVDINATDPVQSGYAISKVFGGGNQAAYTGSPVVRVHDCDNTIEYVYGGGNQASVRGTGVTVYGGSIGYVFGGGYGADVTHDGTDVNIYGGNIGYVFGGNDHSGTVHGDIDVDIQEQAEPNHQLCALTIGEVYGGGQLADAAGGVTVNVRKSVITGDVYGGGAKANTNTGNIIDQQTIDTDLHVTEVNLYPNATIHGDVYGGGRGYKDANPENDIEATVYGDVTVYQLGAVLVPVITDGIAQSGRIFGCNNINGTPKGHVLVYVSKTVKNSESDTYAISAVYGGGNMAEYVPFRIGQDDSDCTEVRIDGCDDVTIHSVYGGGNAASTPATQVFISGAKEIMYVFGGGNGAGNNNPGANVGYHYYDVDGPLGGTTDEDIANRLDPHNHLVYGSGVASTTIYGGHIHYVYGGSNTKGNIREASVSMLDELSDCELQIDGIYGGGRAAYMEGRTSVELGCLTGMEAIYGGSENADVGSDVELTISSGHFDKVFGGNNKGGRIFGSITVNIEQTGCLPITIDELYLGGDNAPYSVYGYKDSTYTVNINGENITHYGLKESGSKYNDPLLNLRSFVSIGTVYGGGNGIHATMVGNPKVDINITHGWINGEYNGTIQSLSQYKGRPLQLANDGVIGTVYGGGNSAKVIGSTNVFIGDKLNDQVDLKSMRTLYNSLGNSDKVKETVTISKTTVNSADAVKYTSNSDANVTITQTVSQTVNGATITGNVYGGGNNADVTGATNIQVGPTIP